MQRILALMLAAAAIAVCAGKTYTITLHQPALAGSTELKAGDHRVQLVDGNAVVIDGKAAVRVPVKVETAGEKYAETTVRIEGGEGKARLMEIRLGGSTTKLVLGASGDKAGSSPSAAGAKGVTE